MKYFISHNKNDKQFVRTLAKRLNQRGINIWLDEWEIKPGKSILDSVEDGILESTKFIIVISKSSLASSWVREELRAALTLRLDGRKDFIIPIILEDCELPLFLRDYLHIDFQKGFERGYSQLISYIIKDISDGELMRLEQIKDEVVEIEGGTFLYGINNDKKIIPYDFLIDKFPVSRRKFMSFIANGAYSSKRYWNIRGWEWMESLLFTHTQDINPKEIFKYRFGHGIFDDKEKLDYPMTHISAWEAEAYCRWVGGRLPNEYEYELSARGKNGLLYPWGNKFLEDHCTTNAMNYSVYDYENGQSPFGIFNLAGEKLEMTEPVPTTMRHIITRGWLGLFKKTAPSVLEGLPKYSIFPRADCFPSATQVAPISFRVVYDKTTFLSLENLFKEGFMKTMSSTNFDQFKGNN